MQRILLLIALIIATSSMAFSQDNARGDRDAWMREMQQYKNDFMAKRLDLTPEQKAKFIPLYNRMDSEVRNVIDQTKKMTKEVSKKGDAATDLELEKAAEAQFECKAKEAKIEMKYFKEFKQILTPRQLNKIKPAEHAFMKELMKKQREHKREHRRSSHK